jgi:hypothetical protein
MSSRSSSCRRRSALRSASVATVYWYLLNIARNPPCRVRAVSGGQ